VVRGDGYVTVYNTSITAAEQSNFTLFNRFPHGRINIITPPSTDGLVKVRLR